MKLIIILLTITALQVSAKGHTQTITLNVKDQPIEKVLAEIKRQTGYTFTYTQDLIDKIKTVTLHVKEATINETLDKCFKDRPFTYNIVDKIISIDITLTTFNETKHEQSSSLIDVKGRVVNEKGEALEGVTVTIKGTKISTSTDVNGEFSLSSIDKEAVLMFTHITMETFELTVSGKTDLAISLKTKVTALGDVQVTANTGYQIVKPNEFNGSLVVIDNKKLNQQTGTNILQRLDGVTSSLYFNIGKNQSSIGPQGKTNITIRGFSTINGPLDPLVVLNNFIYEGDINNINPNDIESITVLKDAAATSIWGARAGNGVIVITTKKGRFNQPLKIELNSNVIFTDKPDLGYLPQISSPDYIDVEQFLYSKGFFNSAFTSSSKPGITPAVEIFRKKALGQISSTDSASQINALKVIDSRDEYNKRFYQKGITQQYSLNLRGGSGNIAWLVSGAYDRTVGTLSEKNDKINIRVDNIYKPLKNLQFGTGVYYTNQKSISGKPAYNLIKIRGRAVPYLKFADDQGNPIAIASNYRGIYTDTVGGGNLLNWKYYPLEDYKHDRTTTNQQELLANISLNYQVIKNLSLNLDYQYQKQWDLSERLSDLESFNARDLINLYTNLTTTVAAEKYPVPMGGVLRKSNASISSQNIRAQIDYNETWGQHFVSAIAGGEIRETKSENDNFTIYGYNKDPLTFSSVDFKTTYPTIVNGSFRTIPGGPSVGGTIINRFVSAYANFLYTYKQRYSLSGSARREGANIFGLSTNDKFKPLWSIGAGWDISKESFYQSSWLPVLRLKATLGYSGNVDLRRTPLPIASYDPSNPYTGFPSANINTINNPSLRWEQVKQWNFAVEFAMKKGIITGSVEYYLKKGTDLYGETPYDYTGWGFLNELTENVAAMKGKGVDIVLKSKNIDKEIKWTTHFLYSYNSNKTTEYYTTSAQRLINLNPRIISPVIGKPLYAIVAYKWGGLNSAGDPQGFLNGQLSTDYDQIRNESEMKGLESGAFKYMGPAIPTSSGALINEFSWKSFSASFNLVYRFGYYFRKSSIAYSSLFNNGAGHNDFEKRWKQPGDELVTNVPAMVYTNYPQFSTRDQFYSESEINVLKGDNIRLQFINIGYSIDNKSKRLPFSRIQLNVNAGNLGIIWRANKEKLDPDYPASIPLAKRYTAGIRAEF